MNNENTVKNKSMLFAVRIVHMYKHLCDSKREYVISKQLLRSGTSIGANIAESEYAISNRDFLSKLYIALKECSETRYWIELLYQTDFLEKAEYISILRDCDEIRRMLSSSTKTLRQKLSDPSGATPDL